MVEQDNCRSHCGVNAHLIGSSFSQAISTMELVREQPLTPGATLYRFVYTDLRHTPLMGAEGPWWVEADTYMKMMHFAVSHGVPLSYVARSLSAIQAEWPEVNGVVRAEVVETLKCWKGKGKIVPLLLKRRGQSKPLKGGVTLEVPQLLIPGIGGLPSLFHKAMRYVSFQSLHGA